MNGTLALAVFVLAYVSVWLLTRRSLFDAVLGFAILAHVGNLIMISAGEAGKRAPLIVTDLEHVDPSGAGASGALADPLTQALILTAIVISMAILIYLVALFRRAATSGEGGWS